MPHITKWEKDGCIIRVFDTLSSDEFELINNEFNGNSHYDETRYFIIDLTRIVAAKISWDDIEIVAYKNAASSLSNKKIRGAFVTNLPAISEIVAYYIHKSAEAGNLWVQAVFSDFETAERWAKDLP